jgi:hypothetical protein
VRAGRPPAAAFWLRVALVGLGAVLTVLLFRSHHVVLGVVVGLLTATRASLLYMRWRLRRFWQHSQVRRRRWR